MAVCSLISASSTGRPCCWITRRKWSLGSNESLEQSAFMNSPLGHGNNSDLVTDRRVFRETRLEIKQSLRLKKIVKRAHLGFIGCSARYFGGAAGGQLTVAGRSI